MNERGDREFNQAIVDKAVFASKILRSYFRGEVHALHNLPEGHALLVGNHNAGITMYDPFLLGLKVYETRGELIHYLGHDAMLSMPFVGPMLRAMGVIRAGHEEAEEAFRAGYKVMVFPGGNHEAFRPYAERHRVDLKGRKGYVRLALRCGVPIVPVLGIGSHESFYVLKRGARLARWLGLKKLLRSDSCPLFLGLPWGLGLGPLFHLPLPTKIDVEVGEPIETKSYGADAEHDEALCEQLASTVQARLQAMMDARAAKRRFPIVG